jgi:hypothetical protein
MAFIGIAALLLLSCVVNLSFESAFLTKEIPLFAKELCHSTQSRVLDHSDHVLKNLSLEFGSMEICDSRYNPWFWEGLPQDQLFTMVKMNDKSFERLLAQNETQEAIAIQKTFYLNELELARNETQKFRIKADECRNDEKRIRQEYDQKLEILNGMNRSLNFQIYTTNAAFSIIIAVYVLFRERCGAFAQAATEFLAIRLRGIRAKILECSFKNRNRNRTTTTKSTTNANSTITAAATPTTKSTTNANSTTAAAANSTTASRKYTKSEIGYFEPQKSLFCGQHSINNLLGLAVATSEQLDKKGAELQQRTAPGNGIHYIEGKGWYSNDLIAEFIDEMDDNRYDGYVISIYTPIPPYTLENVAKGSEYLGLVVKNSGHYIAVKFMSEGDQRYAVWIDSLNSEETFPIYAIPTDLARLEKDMKRFQNNDWAQSTCIAVKLKAANNV